MNRKVHFCFYHYDLIMLLFLLFLFFIVMQTISIVRFVNVFNFLCGILYSKLEFCGVFKL